MTNTVIRVQEQNQAIQRVAFNFEDLTSQAQRYLDGIRAEAAKIMAAARQEAEVIRAQANAEGRAAAAQTMEQRLQQQVTEQVTQQVTQQVNQVTQQLTQQVNQQMATAMPALRTVVKQIHDDHQAWLTHWEKSAIQLAVAIASRIVRREIAKEPEITVDIVRQALELAAGNTQMRIHLNSNDHRTLAERISRVAKEFAGIGSIELIADPNISEGGCRVETQFGVIDQQIESQLARIEEELTD